MKYCPLKPTSYVCDERCVLNDNGCLLRKALKTYINEHQPIEMKLPDPHIKTDKELLDMLMSIRPNLTISDYDNSSNDIPF